MQHIAVHIYRMFAEWPRPDCLHAGHGLRKCISTSTLSGTFNWIMVSSEVHLLLHLLSVMWLLSGVAALNHAVLDCSGTSSLVQIKFITKIYRERYIHF